MTSLSRLHRVIRSTRPLPIFRSFSLHAKIEPSSDEDLEPIDQRRLPADYDPTTFDPTEHRSPPTARIFRLVDELASLTLSEVTELSAILLAKMDLSEPPSIAVMKAGAAMPTTASAAAPVEEVRSEKTVFELKLESFDAAAKLKVIKEVRGFTELGLKEAKELVEKAPAVFKSGVSKEEGEAIVEKMKAAGAKVVMV